MMFENVSASQLAKDLQVSHVTVKRWMREGVSRQKVSQVADYFHINPELLMYNNHHPQAIREKILLYQEMISREIGQKVQIYLLPQEDQRQAEVTFLVKGIEIKTVVTLPEKSAGNAEQIINSAVKQIKETSGVDVTQLDVNWRKSAKIERI